jgi:uridine kinase
VQSLLDQLAVNPPKNARFYAVAIDGRGGSGKTQLATYLGGILPNFLIFNGDDYFEPLKNELAWGGFNEERFDTDVLGPIRHGSSDILHQPYDFELGTLAPAENVEVDQGIVIDRCFSFGLAIEWDMKIWVETPKEVCLLRGIARNPPLDRERVIAVWKQVWQPREDQFIQNFRPSDQADLVIDGTQSFEIQIL